MLTAVDFGVFAVLGCYLLGEGVPPFQVSGAELTFRVLLVAGSHPRDADFDLSPVLECRHHGRGRYRLNRSHVVDTRMRFAHMRKDSSRLIPGSPPVQLIAGLS